MFDFHNPFFCIIYICISFLWILGSYLKIVYMITDEERLAKNNFKSIIVYIVGVLISIIISYFLFQFVRFIQFYY